MCEFCTKHGEGKKWYLQMENYSRELVSARLSEAQRKASGFSTRAEWLDAFSRDFVNASGAPKPAQAPRPQLEERKPSSYALTRRAMLVHFGQVVPLKDAEEVLDRMTSITRFPCGCRYISTGKADKRYCFGLGYDPQGVMGSYPDQSSSLETMDAAEAKRIIREFDRAGLIHTVWTGITPYIIGLCNCDYDCLAYRANIAPEGPTSFFRAEYVTEVDPNLCTGCKSCMKQCQFGAQFYSHSLGKVYIDPQRCYGCGVCMPACTKNAIKLLPRQGHPQAETLWLK
jgi:NAD-dependent dihydropyrimidine dehydrogenase PreA subunit